MTSSPPMFDVPKIRVLNVDQLSGADSVKRPDSAVQKPAREKWKSKRHFMMACISFAVGLGNIWRFPALVYEHNGAAFLIPYFACSFIIGFPLLYLELSLGQFSKVGPAVLYGRMFPLLQGLGWAMIVMTAAVSIYYNMLVAWIVIFIYTIVTGDSSKWSSCKNSFNTQYCFSILEDQRCATEMSGQPAFYFNGSCYLKSNEVMLNETINLFTNNAPISPAEEFFENYVLEKSATVNGLDGLNWKVTAAYFVSWTVTALIIFKGVKIIGKVATFTATVPYIIIAILFVHSVTLEGAMIGLNFYLFEPDFNVLYDFAAWRAAATHVSYSLSVGFGGILTLATYNHNDHNCFRDAAIITLADAFMSIFAGSSVFCVLGFMAHKLNVPIDEVVQSGTGLAFVAYPEALNQMPLSWFWALLFFVMLWILGVSSQFGYGECLCSALSDQFPTLRRHRALVTFAMCGVLFTCGLLLCTHSGVFYFNIFNDYSSTFALTFVLFVESMLVCYLYGYKNYLEDLRTMFGPATSKLSAFFGPTGPYITFTWRFLAPIESAIIFVFSLLTQISYDLTYGKGQRVYVLPRWCVGFGWLLSLIPLLCFPLFGAYQAYLLRRDGKSWRELFRVQPKWPSYQRWRDERHVPRLTACLDGEGTARIADASDRAAKRSTTSAGSAPAPTIAATVFDVFNDEDDVSGWARDSRLRIPRSRLNSGIDFSMYGLRANGAHSSGLR